MRSEFKSLVFGLIASATFAEGSLYVKVGGDDSASGADWDNALATPQVAVDRLGETGGTVYLGEGTFTGPQPLLNLTNATVVIGMGMGKTFLTPDNTATSPTVIQANPGAVVSGVSVTGNSTTRAYKFVGAAGRLELSCVGTNTAGGVWFNDTTATGLVTRCVIAKNSGVTHGGGILVDSAVADGRVTIENTLFDGNTATGNHNSNGEGGGAGSVRGYGSHPKFRYCTFVNNSAPMGGAFVNYYVSGNAITFENCVFYGNTCASTSTTSDFAPGTYGSPYKLVNTYATDAYAVSHPGTSLITGRINLTDFEGGDYRPRLSSCAIDAGVVQTGDTDMADLVGGARVVHEVSDAGCYELPLTNGVFLCDASCPVDEAGFGSSEVTFTSAVFPTGDYTYAWTLLDADGGTVATGTGETWTPTLSACGKMDLRLTVTSTADSTKMTSCTVKRIVNVRPLTTYVVPSDVPGAGDGIAPYDSWAKATTNVQMAVDAVLEGGTVTLSNGTHGIAKALKVEKAITVKGLGGREETTLKHIGTAAERVLYLNCKDARVEGLTLQGGSPNENWTYGFCVKIAAKGGTVADCRLTGVSTGQMGGGAGAHVVSDDGRITRCIIDNNKYTGTYSFYGGGVLLEKGLLDNCLIKGNKAKWGGGVDISGGARMINCTVVENTGTSDAAGGVRIRTMTSGQGQVWNCIIKDNTTSATYKSNAGYPEWYTTATSAADLAVVSNAVVNCCFGKDFAWPIGLTCVNEDPGFTDAAGGDYTLTGSSKLINAGQDYDGCEDDTDLAGNPRKSGAHVDVGAYEFDLSQRTIAFTVSPTLALAGNDVTFTGTVQGGDPSTDYTYAWTILKSGSETVVASGTGNPLVRSTIPAGRYDVTLTVTETVGGAAVGSKTAPDALMVGARTGYVVSPVGYEGDGGTWPYDSWNTATTNLFVALECALPGSTVCLGDGEFVTRQTISLTNAITLTSRNGWIQTTVRHDTTAGNARVVYINHPDAVVEGLTLTGGNFNGSWTKGYAVLIDTKGGTLRKCRIWNNSFYSTMQSGSLAVAYDANVGGVGVVEGCLVDENRLTATAYYDTNGGVYLQGGIFRNNVVMHNTGCQYGGVGVYGSSVVQNNTIVSNVLRVARGKYEYTAGAGGVCFGTSGEDVRFENNLIAFNRDTQGLADFDMSVRASAAVTNRVATAVKNCLFSDGVSFGVDSVAGAPVFRSAMSATATNVNWRLRSRSPGYKAGLYDASWMATGVDFYGEPRTKHTGPKGAVVDIGAAEADWRGNGLLLIVR